MRILLACAGGISTGKLVEAIKYAANDMAISLDIKACSVCDIGEHIRDYDIVLLGPQVRYQIDKIREMSEGIPVEVIDKMDYGLQEGRNILKSALRTIGNT